MTGCSFYKYVHPCDQEDLAQQLGGEVPLEDMEIFDGLFCSDLPSVLKSCVSKPNYKKKHLDSDKCRSFFIRMKSTLTSRGKSVNLNASIYRVSAFKTRCYQIDLWNWKMTGAGFQPRTSNFAPPPTNPLGQLTFHWPTWLTSILRIALSLGESRDKSIQTL